MKRIDAGNPIFEDIIKSNNLYVDKTSYLYNLIVYGNKYNFLSRPRRFGKSLTISTLEAIFKGRRELFKGLYIDSTDYDWKEYPVIHIDFSRIEYISIDDFRSQIKNAILGIAEKYCIAIKESYQYNEVLGTLIDELSNREKVVILIDEYDSPLSNNINNPAIEDIRAVLRGFYSVIKASIANIRFCFITGVTKFSKMSIFSSMNNLTEISMSEEYATMLGYTQKELEDNFSEYIEKGMKAAGETRDEYLAKIKHWYNGYRFAPDSETVYNPVSIGSFFLDGGKVFRNYWINTGGSLLLTEIAKKVDFDITKDTEITVSEDILQAVDIIQMARTEISKENFLSLLYQSGYLTISSARLSRGKYRYTLGYPNEEVEEGLVKILLPLYLGTAARRACKPRWTSSMLERLTRLNALKSIYASIPYNELVFKAENAVHAGFVCMMRIMGAEITSEVATNMGRIDCVLTCPEDIYIIEFKLNKTAGEAIGQIRDKRYYEPYMDRGKKIHLLGINFSTDKEEMNILDWKEEVL